MDFGAFHWILVLILEAKCRVMAEPDFDYVATTGVGMCES